MKGQAPKYTDKLIKSTSNSLTMLASSIVLLTILITQIEKLGSEKSQAVKLESKHEFHFNISQELPIIGQLSIPTEEVIEKISEF